MLRLTKTFLTFILFGIPSAVFAVGDESIVFNPTTGNYLITHYSDIDSKFEQLIFIPATKIKPTINTRFELTREGAIHYGYALTSASNSQQVIRLFILDPVSSVSTNVPNIPLNAPPGKIMDNMADVAGHFDTPALWNATMAYSEGRMSFRIGWGYDSETGGLAPGNKAVFGFKSRDLPSIIQAKVTGFAPDSQEIDGEELPNAEDGGFGQQYFVLLNNNFLLRAVAVPTIAVPAPFDAAVLLDRIRAHVATWPGKQLLDPAFATQLDRYMVAAADAYRLNNVKAGKEHIKKIRELLEHEHKYLDHDDEDNEDTAEHKTATRLTIDRLAARVLDFDLRYVLKRTEQEHEEGDHRKER